MTFLENVSFLNENGIERIITFDRIILGIELLDEITFSSCLCKSEKSFLIISLNMRKKRH